jgi:hypothetical protein
MGDAVGPYLDKSYSMSTIGPRILDRLSKGAAILIAAIQKIVASVPIRFMRPFLTLCMHPIRKQA